MFIRSRKNKKRRQYRLYCRIVLNKKVGDYVKENEILAYIHTNNENVIKEAIEKIQNICKI